MTRLSTRSHRPGLWLLFGLGLCLRLGCGFLQGMQNMEWWKAWTTWALTHPVTRIYGDSDSVVLDDARAGLGLEALIDRHARKIHFQASNWGRTEYPVTQPPLYLYSLSVAGGAYRLLTGGLENRRLFNWFINLISLISAAGIAALIFSVGKRRIGFAAGALGALMFWLNPAALLNGPVHGNLDLLCAFFAVASLAALERQRPDLAIVLAAISVFAKPQGILLFPLVLAAAAGAGNGKGLRRGLLASAVAGGAILVPFVASGHVLSMGLSLLSQRSFMKWVSVGGALSLWWPIHYFFNVANGGPGTWADLVPLDALGNAGFWNPRPAGEIAFVLLFVLLCYRTVRGGPNRWRIAVLSSATAYVAYYVLCPGAHENYDFLAIPIVGLVVAEERRTRTLFLWMTALFTTTYFLFWGLGRDWDRMTELLTRWNLQGVTLALAAAHVALLIAMLELVLRPKTGSTRRDESSQRPKPGTQPLAEPRVLQVVAPVTRPQLQGLPEEPR